jgi:hypothetical protein
MFLQPSTRHIDTLRLQLEVQQRWLDEAHAEQQFAGSFRAARVPCLFSAANMVVAVKDKAVVLTLGTNEMAAITICGTTVISASCHC